MKKDEIKLAKLKASVLFTLLFSFLMSITYSIVNEDHYNVKGKFTHSETIIHSNQIEHVKQYSHDHDFLSNAHTHAACPSHSHVHFCDLHKDSAENLMSFLYRDYKEKNEYFFQNLYLSIYTIPRTPPPKILFS